MSEWTGSSVLASGKVNNSYKSYQCDALTESCTEIDGLSGVQIYTAGLTSFGTLVINGLDSSTNSIMYIRLDPDGEVLTSDAESAIKLSKIVPYSVE